MSDDFKIFGNKEECVKEMQKHTPFGWVRSTDGCIYCITILDDENIYVGDWEDGTRSISYTDASRELEFLDGSHFLLKLNEDYQYDKKLKLSKTCINEFSLGDLIFVEGCEYEVSYNSINNQFIIEHPYGSYVISRDVLNECFI